MSTVNAPIAFHANNDVDLPFAITNADGTPVDTIVGSTFAWTLVALANGLKEPVGGEAAAVSKLSASGGIELNTSTKVATVKIAKTDTAALAPGRYYQELEETRVSGATVVIATGVVQIRPNV